jgi:maleylacetoacetate isomerase
MSETKLTLFHYWRSSGSFRVRWALALKGLAYDAVPINLLNGENDQPTHLRRNPMGYVPVLEVDGRFLAESVAIIEWLDETHPEPKLYPTDPWARAQARQLVETLNAGTQPLHNLNVVERHAEDPAERKRWSQEWIRKGLGAFEALLPPPRAKFSLADRPMAPDLFLIPQCYGALRNEVALEEFPRVAAIYAAALATPECQAAHPDRFAPPTS